MESRSMSGIEATGLIGGAAIKAAGAKAVLGMADVKGGKRAVPTKDELIAELPAFVWSA